MRVVFALAISAALAGGADLALAEGDAAKGEQVFKRCRSCHKVDKPKNGIGPHLMGVVGRKAGTVEKYKYSKAMLAKAAEIDAWEDAELDAYLTDPAAFLGARGKMVLKLPKQEDRDNVIAYLKTIAAPE